ncbi:hypothetical protein HKX48_003004 [Thoreauomyces humboldtii]|nr:hypothetical protein HKX48_003004 [Thoreauomyces humboldtii]
MARAEELRSESELYKKVFKAVHPVNTPTPPSPNEDALLVDLTFRVPKFYAFYENAKALSEHLALSHIPFENHENPIYACRRVWPIPPTFKDKIIVNYFPEQFQSKEEHEFIARIYLGQTASRSQSTRPSRFFNANNFPLYAPRIEELGFDVCVLAASMGKTLGRIVHVANLDPRDIEFVLGGSDQSYVGPDLFVIDFNQCSPHNDNAEEIVRSIRINDPYYPRPGMKGWTQFRDQYLLTAREENKETLGSNVIEQLEKYWSSESAVEEGRGLEQGIVLM